MKTKHVLGCLALVLLAPAVFGADDCELPPAILEGEYFADLHGGPEFHGESDANRVFGLRAGRFLFDDFAAELSLDRVSTDTDDLTQALAGVIVTREPTRRGWMSMIGIGAGISDSHPAIYLSLGGEYRTANEQLGVRVELREVKIFGDSDGRRDSFVAQPMVSFVYHWGASVLPPSAARDEAQIKSVKMLPPLTNPPESFEPVSVRAMSAAPADREFVVRFAQGSSSASAEALAIVADVVDLLKGDPKASVFIAGHSDVSINGLSDAMADRQLRLGRARAEALLSPFKEADIPRERVQYETNGTNEERLGTAVLRLRVTQ